MSDWWVLPLVGVKKVMSAHSPDDKMGRMLCLREEVTRIAGSLADLALGIPIDCQADEPVFEGEAPAVSVQSVEFLIRARRERARYFPRDLFAEPPWDIMLELLRSELVDQRVNASDLCLASGVPDSTTLRWIAAMVTKGLLVRDADPQDGQKPSIKLSVQTSASLRRYFAEVVEAA